MKYLPILVLNIPICIILNYACDFIILSERIYPDTFKNPAIILLISAAVIVDMFIVYEILKRYKLVSKKSLLICLPGVVITWVLYYIIGYLKN